jgi:hypothetical protein
MSRHRGTLVALGAVLSTAPALAAQSASGEILVSAQVSARPLSIVGVSRTALPGTLLVTVAGCGTGTLSVDAQAPTQARRTATVRLEVTDACAPRPVLLTLAADRPDVASYLITLEQSTAMLSPAFTQFVVPASAGLTKAPGSVGF